MYITSNHAMSADGKIATSRYDLVSIGSPEDQRRMAALRAEADAVLVGGTTFRNWPFPLVERRSMAALRPRPIVNAVLTRRGLLDEPARARIQERFPDPRVRLILLGPPSLDVEGHRAAFGAEVLTSPNPDVRWAVQTLAALGCERVVSEGGGDLLFQLLEADLLDEVRLTVCPLIIGGKDAPSPVDGRGFPSDQARRLALLDVERLGDELFLRYKINKLSSAPRAEDQGEGDEDTGAGLVA